MNTTKTYAAKSSVTRALKAAGLKIEDYTVVAVEGGFAGYLETNSVSGFETHGLVACPHCSIHLSNGVGYHGDEVNGKAIKHDAFEFVCLACGGEFGSAISKKAKKTPAVATGEKKPRNGACKKVWDMADSKPDAKRSEVVSACVAAGINLGTSKTQYQAWFASKRG